MSSLQCPTCGHLLTPPPIYVQAIRPNVRPTNILDAPGTPATSLARSLEDIALEQHTAAARGVTPDVYALVRNILPGVQYHAGANMLLFHDTGADVPKPSRLPGRVAVIGGSSRDLVPAYEAVVTLGLMGGYGTMYQGVSASDLPGVVQTRSSIADADAIIVCCSEQPALAGLFAGMVSVPVVAVPGAGRPDPNLAFSVAGTHSFHSCLQFWHGLVQLHACWDVRCCRQAKTSHGLLAGVCRLLHVVPGASLRQVCKV
jgi:phosphoribosylcarboxyaminoimidazole (NCAIR) mutase